MMMTFTHRENRAWIKVIISLVVDRVSNPDKNLFSFNLVNLTKLMGINYSYFVLKTV